MLVPVGHRGTEVLVPTFRLRGTEVLVLNGLRGTKCLAQKERHYLVPKGTEGRSVTACPKGLRGSDCQQLVPTGSEAVTATF